MTRVSTLFSLAAVLVCATASHSAPATKKPKPTVKPPVKNETKGQGQMAGLNGEFGQVYTLDDGFNFEILGAHYTLEPFLAYETQQAGTDKKIVVIDIAMKNATASDNWLDPADIFTLVDAKGQLYPTGTVALTSKSSEASFTLRPGQGVGQPALNDPLRAAVVVPGDARIVKIMLNHGRKGHDEKVIRYYVAGATAAEAGEAGDPKNVITPLPDDVRDTSDPSGAIALVQGKGTLGVYKPSGAFAIRLDSFSYSTDPLLNGAAPDEGKQYAIATITAKSLVRQDLSVYDVTGGDDPLYEITDADGERYKPVGYRKAKRDEDPDHTFKQGDEYTMRIIFAMPKDAKAKTLTLGAGNSRVWSYDVSAM